MLINNEKQLVEFLKRIAENAVTDSRKILEKDPYVDNFNIMQQKNKSLYEQEEEEENPEEEPEEENKTSNEPEEEADSGAEEKEEPKKDDNLDGSDKLTPAAKKALSLPSYEEGQTPNFDVLLSAINLVRAGNSLKDREVKTELRDYYEKLDENEKSILILFLKELAKITTRAIDGDEAQDPSDSKAFFKIIKTNDASQKNVSDELSQDKQITKKPSGLTQSPAKGLEDTSPPIKVNESQDLTAIRKKIKSLIRD
jgi:hypothetical protein